ncbi:MAG: anti-sigma factor domain-containing protein [Nonlabens sp.]|uniref:anti-sigma factor domain-containing protein n=1 Tax=Nonlabens sp. TaxID=1888209 RepID=UPI003EFA8A74
MKKYLALIAAATLTFTSCSNDDDNSGNTTTRNLTIDLQGLEDLGNGFAYEGWIMVNGSPVTTGVFTVDDSGNLSQTTFAVDAATLDAATAFILTIEPSPDTDPAPADSKYIAGEFTNDTASLTTDFGPAPGDFTNASGSYFLRTPTDETGMNNGNDTNGVWFGLPGMPPTADFNLPTLPAGWVYEGWVVGDAGPLSTGTFSDFSTQDSGNGFSGTQNNVGPPVPGEDFFNNLPAGESLPFSVVGRNVVITVEPVPDNSPAPFTLKPLASIAGTDTAPNSQSFNNNVANSFPTGSVSR